MGVEGKDRETTIKHNVYHPTIPLRCSLFVCIVLNIKSQLNLIFKMKSNGIKFDRDFIFKTMPEKK